MEVDLITGFLGVGKTTFIRSYLKYLEKKGQKAAVIENEFGSVDIDSQLLQDTGCPISSLAGECMCCTGKDTFRHMLMDAAEEGVDRVLVEPSGIYDVDEFFDVAGTGKKSLRDRQHPDTGGYLHGRGYYR